MKNMPYNHIFLRYFHITKLKYISKICGLDFEIVPVTRTRITFFVIQIAFHNSHIIQPDFLGSIIKIPFNLKSREIEKVELSSEATYNLQTLENEICIIADYKYAKIFQFSILHTKL